MVIYKLKEAKGSPMYVSVRVLTHFVASTSHSPTRGMDSLGYVMRGSPSVRRVCLLRCVQQTPQLAMMLEGERRIYTSCLRVAQKVHQLKRTLYPHLWPSHALCKATTRLQSIQRSSPIMPRIDTVCTHTKHHTRYARLEHGFSLYNVPHQSSPV